MKTKYIFIAFIVTALVQLFAPLKMVYDNEMTVRNGTVYKFKTEPIDPSDPFRGKYVALNFQENSVVVQDSIYPIGEQLYALIANDSTGFAVITGVAKVRPDSTINYITVKSRGCYEGLLRLDLPFNVFYMEEGKAQEAENGYRKYTKQDTYNPAYALVAVKEGNAVVTDVIIDGLSIRKYVLRERKK